MDNQECEVGNVREAAASNEFQEAVNPLNQSPKE